MNHISERVAIHKAAAVPSHTWDEMARKGASMADDWPAVIADIKRIKAIEVEYIRQWRVDAYALYQAYELRIAEYDAAIKALGYNSSHLARMDRDVLVSAQGGIREIATDIITSEKYRSIAESPDVILARLNAILAKDRDLHPDGGVTKWYEKPLLWRFFHGRCQSWRVR